MGAVIGESGAFNTGERNLLFFAYQTLTGLRRSAVQTITAFLEDEAIPERVATLSELKAKLVKELDDCCTRIIQLIDAKLLPAAVKVSYQKLKADF
jgi:hypothetical protein